MRESHEKMLHALEGIRIRAADENPFLGDRDARSFRAEIAAFGPRVSADQRFDGHMRLGIAEMNLGNEQAAIENLEMALNFGIEADVQISERYEALYFLSLANIRLAETENCCRTPSEDSCIYPLEGGGIHTRPEGSQRAIELMTEILAIEGLDEGRWSETVWLINLAAMTLGKHPEAVPVGARLPEVRRPENPTFPRFRNIASNLGIDTFSLSGGVAADDFDGDGLCDLIISSWDPTATLIFWKNDGRGGFVDHSEEANLSGLYGGLNMRHADFDNDGDLDLLVLRGAYLDKVGNQPNSLLQNDGTGRFTDVTFACGLAKANYPTQTGDWVDYDLDGDLDLFVGNESTGGNPAPNQLFRNDGRSRDSGFVQFVDVAKEAGIATMNFTKGVHCGDYDGDRYPDLYVSNQGEANQLFRNNGDGTFSDVASKLGVIGPQRSFPLWFWDFNNDGALDLFVSDYNGTPSVRVMHRLGGQFPQDKAAALYAGDGKGGFSNVSGEVGLAVPMLPMGSNFGDVNNDGFPDIYLGTGAPEYSTITPNLFLLNRGGKQFEDLTTESGLGHLQKGHAIAFADFDHDGDLDIFEQMGGAFPGDRYYDALFENPGFPGSHFLEVKLEGTGSNRSGIGCRIRAVVEDQEGERSIYSRVNSGGSFGGSPLTQHLGLGKATAVKRLEIFWPVSNKTQVFEDVPADQRIVVTEGENRFVVVKRKPIRFAVKEEFQSGEADLPQR